MPNPGGSTDVYPTMVSLASRARTSLSIAGALGTIVAALLLSPSASPAPARGELSDDGWRLEGRLASTKILPGAMEHHLVVRIRAPFGERVGRAPTAVAIVIDRSGSMTDNEHVTPMSDAKAAATRLVEAL